MLSQRRCSTPLGGSKSGRQSQRLFGIRRRTGFGRAGHFHEPELATLALTDEMTHDIGAEPATMKRIRAVLPDDQVVELIGIISGYDMVSRFVVATGLEPEAS